MNKFFDQFRDCIHYVDNVKTPYTAAKVLHKAHNTVIE